ncbi:hypothetical protein BH11BAC2_BH11BAC2_22490 [soil metagenome]
MNLKAVKIGFFLLLLFATSITIAQKQILTPSENVVWKTFDTTAYSIQYPGDWELDKSGKMNTSFILFSPVMDANDQFKENVNLLVQDLGEDKVDLTQYTDLTIGQIKKGLPNSTLLLSKRIKSETSEYQKMIYTGDQSTFHLQFEQYYRIMDGKAIVLTFSAEQSTFESYQELAERILNSFVIK